jgi:hypothetical protein
MTFRAKDKVAMLYLAEEALGFRLTLHYARNFLEKGIELRQLVTNVARENYYDEVMLTGALFDNDCVAQSEIFHWMLADGYFHVPDEEKRREWPGREIILPPLEGGYRPHKTPLHEQLGNDWSYFQWKKEVAETYYIEDVDLMLLRVRQLMVDSSNGDAVATFRFLRVLFGPKTIAQAILVESDLKFFGQQVASYYNVPEKFMEQLGMAISESTEETRWEDALSRNQVKSKIWLLEKLEKTTGELSKKSSLLSSAPTTFVISGGWLGVLPFLGQVKDLNLKRVINVELDNDIVRPSTTLNKGIDYKLHMGDIKERKFFPREVLIDTIIEHFVDHDKFLSKLPKDTLVVLQGNDMFNEPDHVNCHNTLEEFVASTGITNVLYKGELSLPGCTRFMLIGRTG